MSKASRKKQMNFNELSKDKKENKQSMNFNCDSEYRCFLSMKKIKNKIFWKKYPKRMMPHRLTTITKCSILCHLPCLSAIYFTLLLNRVQCIRIIKDA